MRRPTALTDSKAREAFAFLAIGLLVISSFYVAFTVSIEREQRVADRELLYIRASMGRADEAVSSLEELISTSHDEVFTSSERNLLMGKKERLHVAMQMKLEEALPERIDAMLRSLNESGDNLVFHRTSLTIEVLPVLAGITSPVPWTSDDGPNGTGASEEGMRCESLGTDTRVACTIIVEDPLGTLELERDVDISRQRASLSDLLGSRQRRVANGLRGGELHRTANYILSSMAQQKSLMGYGRGLDTATGAFFGDVLTKEEVVSYVELAVTLTVQGHLRDLDGPFLDNLSRRLKGSQGAGGGVADLEDLMNGTHGPFDPAYVALAGEGIGSEANPPALEDMVRPLLMSAVDQTVIKILSFLGLHDSLLGALGGAVSVIEAAGKLINTFTSSFLAKEILNEGEETAEDLLIGPLVDAGLEEEKSLTIRRETFPEGFEYGGSPVTEYPPIEVEGYDSTIQLHLTDNSSDRIYLKDEADQVFLMSDNPDREGVYYANRCDVYTVELRCTSTPIPPSFESLDLMQNDDFLRQLISYLGDPSLIDDEKDRAVVEGEMIVKKAIDRVIELFSGPDDLWDELYHGWDESTLSIQGDIPPISYYVNGSIGPLEELVDAMVSWAIEAIGDTSLMSSVGEANRKIGAGLAGWIYGEYDELADTEEEADRASSAALEEFLRICEIEVVAFNLTGTSRLPYDRCIFPPGGVGDIQGVLDDRSILVQKIDNEPLMEIILPAVERSLELIKEREFSIASDNVTECGIIAAVLLSSGGEDVRSGILPISLDAKEEIKGFVSDLIEGTLKAVDEYSTEALRVLGARTFLPSPPADGVMSPEEWNDDGPAGGKIASSSRMTRTRPPNVEISRISGRHPGEIYDVTPRFLSRIGIRYDGGYAISFSLEGPGYGRGVNIDQELNLTLDLELEVATPWALHGFFYVEGPTIIDMALDTVGELGRDALVRGASCSTDLLGDTMSSLSELPPLMVEMGEGKDLDLSEVSRVLTNISMDASRAAREGVKEMIRSLVDEGVSTAVIAGAEALKIEEVRESLSIGGASLEFSCDIAALKGDKGALIDLDLAYGSIGLDLHMSLDRKEDGSVVFNCTLSFEVGPAAVHLELDPLMDEHPYMISIGCTIERGDEDIRIAVQCPELVRFRTLEASLSSTLGIAPQVPIPPLGISAFIDAGIQLRYRMPSELGPHINEVRSGDGNITAVEVYDPTSLGISGSTLELRDGRGYIAGSWRLEGSGGAHHVVPLSDENLIGWFGRYDTGQEGFIILRSPSGEVWDEAEVEGGEGEWYSRDMDGFGVFRWGEGTPGAPNGGEIISISSLILSIIKSSISEAWKEAYALHGLSFGCLVHLVQRFIELFIERAISAIRELVIEVRMFLELKVSNAGTGTAGVGIQIAFIAEGEAFARFLRWVYENIVTMIGNMRNPQGALSLSGFPLDILSYCHIEGRLFSEVEMPPAIGKMMPVSAPLPDSLNIGIVGRFNLALPLTLAGMDAGMWKVSAGVVVLDPPAALVSLFYDISPGTSCEFWLLRASIWSE